MDVEQITQEIVDLHVEFERWFHGTSPSLERVEASLAPDFVFVGTSADVLSRDQVLGFLRSARNQQTVRIGIDDVRAAWERGGLVGANYVEVHSDDTTVTRRRASCVMQADDAAPDGLLWLSVHETWIDPPPVA